jgi:hypothetical protein
MNTAVLLLAFNRPDTTARVFAAIRAARPPRLYVAADGPRASRPGEAELCAQVRRMATAVDWHCELHTQFRDGNLGCKRNVASALDWFFSREERGIVLEDDCLPSGSFFRFCEELLECFRDDPLVFSIQGNYFGGADSSKASYVFSKMFYMWGWASWADRWRSVSIHDIDVAGIRRAIARDRWLGRNPLIAAYWLDIVERQARGRIDSWGYPVMFHCFKNKLFNVTPTSNLVLNIGTGPAATRTSAMDCGPYHKEAADIEFPLRDGSRYEGAQRLLPYEHRWRIQLKARHLAAQLLDARFPRVYQVLRRLRHGLRRPSA